MKFGLSIFCVFFFASFGFAQLFSIDDLSKLNAMTETDFQNEMKKYQFSGFDTVESDASRILIYSNDYEHFAIAKAISKTKKSASKVIYSFGNKVFYDKYLSLVSDLKYQPIVQEQFDGETIMHFRKGNQLLDLITTQDPETNSNMYKIEVSQE
ncbi:hypothetical protein [Soonwooa sp.]|uniref:hypothetical protein n=1 Tax=Soonwooa sp. TaxID=1938592 RepID=UPI002602A3F4|nr:hypothetical protein [Soonwooa sp.]